MLQAILSKKGQNAVVGLDLYQILKPEWIHNADLTPTDKKKLLCVREVVKEYRYTDLTQGDITSTQSAGMRACQLLQTETQEKLIAFFLNTKNKIINVKTIFVGTANSSTAHPREIFREAILQSAVSVIIAHNHPSGNAEPSSADLEFTKRLRLASEVVGIQLLDHIIVGGDDYKSLREITHILD